MIAKIIEWSVRNRWLVIFAWLAIALWGLYAVFHTPVDAIPDLSENQVIVFADWMGRSPQDIEEQVTYPLSVQLQGLAGVKAVRSSSEPNFSMINIIFDDHTDLYFARQRVLERLTTAKAALPPDVMPVMAPDATALGQIFWYTVEGGGKSLDELRAIQDFIVRYQLGSIPGVAEVASVGGFVREYQVDVDPAKLRLFDLPLSAVYSAIAASNMSVSGKAIEHNQTEYLIRGIGWLRGLDDLESVVVSSRAGVPIHLREIASVQFGPGFRRSALEKNGEAVGGVVMMRVGQNPLEITRAIKRKIVEMQSGLPAGVRIVPFYDRTRLIESAIHTVTGTLREEIIIASIAILLILTHLRSAIVVCITLPMAVLISFLFMYYLDLPSNIMSLSGIAISIGILVDAAVVMVENASHELKDHFGDKPVSGDTTDIVVRSCRLVGRPIFFSVIIMLISFLPIFAFGGQEGKLSHPLAFTKSFAMIGVALLAVTLVPALIPLLIRGRLRGEEENPIVRSFIHIYKPLLTWIIDRPGIVWFITSLILSLGAACIGWSQAQGVALAAGIVMISIGPRLIGSYRQNPTTLPELGAPPRSHWHWQLASMTGLVIVAWLADVNFRKLGGEFMPELNEGSIMDMPMTSPRIAMSEAVDDVQVRDRVLRSFPEVELAVGKIGRAETATDPSPVDMVETIISLRPPQWWPKRKIEFDDVVALARRVVPRMQANGWLRAGSADTEAVIQTAAQVAYEKFDRDMRELARRRQAEYQPQLATELVKRAMNQVVDHARTLRGGALLRQPDAGDETAAIAAGQGHGLSLVELPRPEEADALLATLRDTLVQRHVLADRDDLLVDAPGRIGLAVNDLRSAIGVPRADFSQRAFDLIEVTRDELWQARIKTLNWELFDYGKSLINDLLIDALYRSAAGTPLAAAPPEPTKAAQLRQELTDALGPKLLLWQKSKNDLVTEMNGELQMPGWGNAWTQPIINRVNMLATGVRTQVGIKVFGPTGKPLEEAVADVQRVSEQIAQRLRGGIGNPGVDGASDIIVEQANGKRFLEVRIDRERAARYGVNVAEVSQAIETAMGGTQVTTTVEGRMRFPVRLRYARDYWQDIDAIKEVLVAGAASPVSLGLDKALGSASSAGASVSTASDSSGMPAAGGAASGGSSGVDSAMPKGGGVILIPLREVADLKVVEGPAMIKSEDGRLRNYVTLNVRGRDVLGFIDEARQALRPIEAQLAGTGMSIAWTGEFENQVRARQTLAIIFPLVIALIAFLLFITFRQLMDVLLVLLAVLGALAGAVMFQAIFKFNFSVIVSIGYVAAFGMATQTGVIMLVYLREAIDRRGGLSGIKSLEELRECVIAGAVHRLRPKLLTEGVAIVGLVPMLWATGTGAEIMRPMAAPVLGGLLISDEVIDIMIPVLFYWLRRRKWLKTKSITHE